MVIVYIYNKYIHIYIYIYNNDNNDNNQNTTNIITIYMIHIQLYIQLYIQVNIHVYIYNEIQYIHFVHWNRTPMLCSSHFEDFLKGETTCAKADTNRDTHTHTHAHDLFDDKQGSGHFEFFQQVLSLKLSVSSQ